MWRPSLLVIACLAACSRPPDEAPPEPYALAFEQVKVTTFKGAAVSAKGTARRLALRGRTLKAQDVTLTTATGSTVTAPSLEGPLDAARLEAPAGGKIVTTQGCQGATSAKVERVDALVTAHGPVAAQGCGLELDGQGLTYELDAHRAVISGQVHTRFEATP